MPILLISLCFAPTITSIQVPSALAQEEYALGVLISQRDSTRLLIALGEIWQKEEGARRKFPRLIAQNPGPLVMDSGLKLLANAVLPSATVPDVLLISTYGELTYNQQLLAFVRRCLIAGSRVIVVGDQFPEAMLAWQIPDGTQLQRCDLAELSTQLKAPVTHPSEP